MTLGGPSGALGLLFPKVLEVFHSVVLYCAHASSDGLHGVDCILSASVVFHNMPSEILYLFIYATTQIVLMLLHGAVSKDHQNLLENYVNNPLNGRLFVL